MSALRQVVHVPEAVSPNPWQAGQVEPGSDAGTPRVRVGWGAPAEPRSAASGCTPRHAGCTPAPFSPWSPTLAQGLHPGGRHLALLPLHAPTTHIHTQSGATVSLDVSGEAGTGARAGPQSPPKHPVRTPPRHLVPLPFRTQGRWLSHQDERLQWFPPLRPESA